MRGAPHLLAASILTLAASLIVLILQAAASGTLQVVPIVRLALLVGLVLAMYRGAHWARWLVGILGGLSGLVSLIGVAALFQVNPPIATLFLLVALAFLGGSVLLLASPALRDYVESRRPSVRAPEPPPPGTPPAA